MMRYMGWIGVCVGHGFIALYIFRIGQGIHRHSHRHVAQLGEGACTPIVIANVRNLLNLVMYGCMPNRVMDYVAYTGAI
jgi:hypothetical protein